MSIWSCDHFPDSVDFITIRQKSAHADEAKEKHVICDDCSGYEYVINKAFKPAKSHAAEVELLCTYAPNDEYGEEGNVPYVAVQIDDMVYCAVEQ